MICCYCKRSTIVCYCASNINNQDNASFVAGPCISNNANARLVRFDVMVCSFELKMASAVANKIRETQLIGDFTFSIVCSNSITTYSYSSMLSYIYTLWFRFQVRSTKKRVKHQASNSP